MFLNVAARLLARIPEAVFLIVGDGPLRQDLERQAQERGISARVRFLGTRNDTPELFNLFDVTVLTSNNEASPVSILESLACGTPLVATNVGSVAETVLEGETGYLVPAGGISEATERISWLVGDPLGAQEMGRRGRNLVLRDWSLGSMVQGYQELLEGLFCRRTGQPGPPRAETPTATQSWQPLDVAT
jgi:glycosyltransferase involved in cell wall biosynthesis